MSLKQFHIVFIVVCGLLCLFLCIWGTVNWDRVPGAPGLFGVGSLGAVGLAAYLRFFLDKSGKGLKATACLIAAGLGASLPRGAAACPMCFGGVEGNTAAAFNWGIFFMAGLVLLTLGGITAMMVRAVRAKGE